MVQFDYIDWRVSMSKKSSAIVLCMTAMAGCPSEPTKYNIGDCVLATASHYSWYKEEARITDIYRSEKYGGTVYEIEFPHREGPSPEYPFAQESIDNNTVKIDKEACNSQGRHMPPS